MKNLLISTATRAAVVLALASPFAAQAGLVTGSWDPLFGSSLPGLSYQVKADFFVPDACSDQGDGTFSVISGACAGSNLVRARLRLFDPGSDPNNFDLRDDNSFWFDMAAPFNDYGVAEVRVQNAVVVGVSAGLAVNLPALTPPSAATFNGVVATALGNSFGVHFTVNGPVVTCFQCVLPGGMPSTDNPNVLAGTTGLTQFLVTFNDNQRPKSGTDARGNPIGAVLDSNGGFVRLGTDPNLVPEPGSLGMALAALLALGAVGQRRRRH